MRQNILDTLVRGLVLSVLVLFGLRGVLPDIISSEWFSLVLSVAAAVILGFAVGQYAYRCPPACDPKVCRIG